MVSLLALISILYRALPQAQCEKNEFDWLIHFYQSAVWVGGARNASVREVYSHRKCAYGRGGEGEKQWGCLLIGLCYRWPGLA